jgi:hypothetical protein
MTTKYLRRTTSGAAGNCLGTAINYYLCAAAGNDLGTTIKYLRRTAGGAAVQSLGTTIEYLRSAAGMGTTNKYLRRTQAAARATAWAPRLFTSAAPRSSA